MVLLCVQLCPELGQHLIILLASASVPLQVLLSCLLQMLLHFLVHLTCTAPKCSLQEAQMGVSSSRTCQQGAAQADFPQSSHLQASYATQLEARALTQRTEIWVGANQDELRPHVVQQGGIPGRCPGVASRCPLKRLHELLHSSVHLHAGQAPDIPPQGL